MDLKSTFLSAATAHTAYKNAYKHREREREREREHSTHAQALARALSRVDRLGTAGLCAPRAILYKRFAETPRVDQCLSRE